MVIVNVVGVGIEVIINFWSSKVALVNVDPDNPETVSNRTISFSLKLELELTVMVTLVEELVLEKVAPVNVVLIGWMS
tara:strand:- start:52 stop:285 length:234 start_codon:yes stop_codon:yes gene_type:complete